MSPRQQILVQLAVAGGAVAVLTVLFYNLRSFVRFSFDGRTRRRHMPWWAIVSAGLAFYFAGLAFDKVLGYAGAVIIGIGLVSGAFARFRVFSHFDVQDRDDHPDLFKHGRGGSNDPVYAPEPELVLQTARRNLVISLVLFAVGIGTYRYARSMPGELGFGGVIFLFPLILGFGGGFLAGTASLIAFLRYVVTAPPMEKAAPHQPDPEAVRQLLEHGALPEGPPTSLVPSKDAVLGVVACLIAGALWLTDPPSTVRQFVVAPLALYGAFLLGRLLWKTARDRL